MVWTLVILSSVFFVLFYTMDLIEQADTFKITLACIVGSIVFIMDVYGIYLALNFDRHEREYTLYIGAASQAMSIVFWGASIKYEYVAFHNKISILFIVMVMCSYAVTICATMHFIFNALKTGYFTKTVKMKHPKLLLLIPLSGGTALIIGRLARFVLTYDANILMMSIIALLLSWPCAIGVHNIYKYMLIRHFENYKKPRSVRKSKDG